MFAVENRHQPGYSYPVHHLTVAFAKNGIFQGGAGERVYYPINIGFRFGTGRRWVSHKTNVRYQHTGYNNTMYIL